MARCVILLLLALLTARASETATVVNYTHEPNSELSESSVISDLSDNKSDLSDIHKSVTFSDEAYILNTDGDIKNRSVRKLNEDNIANKVLDKKEVSTQIDIRINTPVIDNNSNNSKIVIDNEELLVPITDILNGNRNTTTETSNKDRSFVTDTINYTDKEYLEKDTKTNPTQNIAIPVALEQSPHSTNETDTKTETLEDEESDAISVALGEVGSSCPARCQCGVTSQELRCSERAPPREPATLVIAGEKHYVNIECREAHNLTCSEIPPYDVCGGREGVSVGVSRCRVRGALRCARHRLRVGTVGTLTYKDVPPGTVLEKEDFEGVPELDRLIVRCSSSDKVSLSAGALSPLGTLRRLVVSGVRLAVSPQPRLPRSLSLLELNAGGLTAVPRAPLTPLSRLEKLMLFNNAIESVEEDAFDDLPLLWQLDLSANRLSAVPLALLRVRTLLSLSLSRNLIHELIPLTPLHGLVNLTLSMSLVELTISPGALSNMTNLTNVDLRFNRIRSLPPNTFHGSRGLTKLDLSYNALSDLPVELLSDQTALQRLDLSHNKLKVLDSRQFEALQALTVLKLEYNLLKELPVRLLYGARSLTQLSLSHNSLLTLRRASLAGATEIEDIDLSYNNLTFYDPDVSDNSYHQLDLISPFNGLTKLRKIRLSHNAIKSSFHDVATTLTKLETYDLSYNEIKELGFMDELYFISANVTVDLRHNKVHSVFLRSSPMLTGIDSRNSKILLNDNPFHCDCNMYELARRINGERPNPDFAPSEPKFDVDNAICDSPKELEGRLLKNLRLDELSCELEAEYCPENCQCRRRPAINAFELTCKVPPTKFPVIPEGLIKVKLTEAPISLAEMSPLVAELDLSGLGLQTLPSDIPPVRLLNLTQNKLTIPPIELLERDNMTLLLAGNKFSCDCSHARDLKEMQDHKYKIGDSDKMTCSNGDLLVKMPVARLCDTEKAALLGGLLALFGVMVAIAAILMYRHSLVVKVFLFKYGICIFDEDDLDDDKIYDAFLSFSHQDEKLVIDQILPGLESGPRPFRICVHYRDWIPGEWIPAQIARSVEQSRRTIVVLSKNFLDSIWGRLEFRTAHMSAVKESRSRVIVILLEDVTGHEELDVELKAYLATNTYLKWGETGFWDKLRFALPRRRGERRARLMGRSIVQEAIGGSGKRAGGIEACLTKEGKLVNIAAIKAAPA